MCRAFNINTIHFKIFLLGSSGLWKHHYIIPENIPDTGQQEVCSIQSAKQTEMISLKCIVTTTQARWNSFFLENTTFSLLSCQDRRAGSEGRAGKTQQLFSTGSHAAEFEKCNVSYNTSSSSDTNCSVARKS